MTDTIPAPALEHDERCRHTDCVGECCEPCANMPKADPATKQPDGMTERERGAWELYLASPLWELRKCPWEELSSRFQGEYLAIRDRAEQLFKARADEQRRITQELCNERVKRVDDPAETDRGALAVFWAECKAHGTNPASYAWELLTHSQRDMYHREWGFLRDRVEQVYESTSARQLTQARAEVERLTKELAASNRVRDEYKESQVKLMRTLSQVQAERTAAWKERDELARKLEGANAEVSRLTARNAELVAALQAYVDCRAGAYDRAQGRRALAREVVSKIKKSCHEGDELLEAEKVMLRWAEREASK